MNRLMLSAVVVGLALAGCDYGDPKLPFPETNTGETGSPTGGGGGTAQVEPPDAGSTGGGVGDGGTGGGMADGGVMPDAGVAARTIAELAQSRPELELFMRAADKAGLVGPLMDASSTLTVFAPDNAAFAALLTELGLSRGFEELSAEQLRTIMRYHVLSTKVTANDAVTAAGQMTKLDAQGGRIAVGVERAMIQLDQRASVTTADIMASNGVLHVIDRVLLPSVTDVLATSASHTRFASALAMADNASPSPGLAKSLDDDTKSLTVFAPDDRAFDKLMLQLVSAGVTGMESLRPDQLVPIAKYHVLESKVASEDLRLIAELRMMGGVARATRVDPTFDVDLAHVKTADLYCSNGVLHVIDAVLMPSITDVLTTDERFRALSAAVTAADADPTLIRRVGDALDSANQFTFFAPSNQAFTELGAMPAGAALANALFFHAVPGSPMYSARAVTFTSPVTLLTSIDRPLVLVSSGSPPRVTLTDGMGGQASVTQTDLFTANGVIHVIDRVLVAPP